jgi:hypothetical protein
MSSAFQWAEVMVRQAGWREASGKGEKRGSHKVQKGCSERLIMVRQSPLPFPDDILELDFNN